MAARFDRVTLDRLRALPSRQVFEEVKNAVYGSGAASSDDFLDLYEQLVDEGILTWEQVEQLER